MALSRFVLDEQTWPSTFSVKQTDDKGSFVLSARISRSNLWQTPSRYFNHIWMLPYGRNYPINSSQPPTLHSDGAFLFLCVWSCREGKLKGKVSVKRAVVNRREGLKAHCWSQTTNNSQVMQLNHLSGTQQAIPALNNSSSAAYNM